MLWVSIHAGSLPVTNPPLVEETPQQTDLQPEKWGFEHAESLEENLIHVGAVVEQPGVLI